MDLDPSILWDFAGEVVGTLIPVRRSVPATVTRVDPDGTVWATTGDGTEAPAASASAGVKSGDVVDVEWAGATMRITGNASDPAPSGSVTRRLTQHAQAVADAASRVANAVNQHFFADGNGIHVTESTQEDWNASHTGANVLINSVGQLFRDGLVNLLTLTTESGSRALTVWDGLGNAVGNIRAIIGETIILGPVGSVQMMLSSGGLKIDNEDGDEIFAIDSGSTGSVTIALDASLVTWSATSDVSTATYTVNDAGTAAGTPTVTAAVNGADYPLDSTYATATVTAGTGVAVALTSDGVDYVRTIMVEEYEDEGSTVTTTYPCELSVEYQHAVTDVALLSLIGSQEVEGEGNVLVIVNDRWTAGTRQSSTLVRLRNAITGREVKLGVSGNGYTRGLWDSTVGDWVIARDRNNRTVINGPNFSVGSDGTVDTTSTIASRYQVSVRGNGSTSATRRIVALRSNSAGNRGLYDVSLDKWMLYKRSDGTLVLNEPLYDHTGSCTATSSVAVYNNVNYCWHNGATCSVVLAVSLEASLDNAATLVIATVPLGFRPPHAVYASLYTTGTVVTGNVYAMLSATGQITLNNRSGGSIGTGTHIYMSFTFAM